MPKSNLRSLLLTIQNTSTRRAQSGTGISGVLTLRANNISSKMVLNKSASTDPEYEFVFPYSPINIQYDNLSAEWTEINRPGRTPLVDYSQNKLLQVSFKFLVARPFDGIAQSVDNDLVTLRYMASSQRTVSLFGMDGMLTNPFQIPGQPLRSSGGFFFHIIDFSINSLRRNKNNEITAAECSITLSEVNNPQITVVQFPKIEYPVVVPPKKKPSTTKPPSGVAGLTATQAEAYKRLVDAGIPIFGFTPSNATVKPND